MSRTILIPGITQPRLLTDPIYEGSNFAWGEATAWGTRIPKTTDFQGVTIPATQITANIIKIARELDIIRANFGNKPIIVTSWYRPPNVNRAVGGAKFSQHVLGWGVDIQVDGTDAPNVANKLAITWVGGLGNNRKYTHLDLRHLMGWASARWDYGVA